MRIPNVAFFMDLLLAPAIAFGASPQDAAIPATGSIPLIQEGYPQMPGAASSLAREWTRGGGARMYRNTVNEPRGLKRNGSKRVDPALVPPLNTGKGAASVKKRVKRPHAAKPAATRKARAKPKTVAKLKAAAKKSQAQAISQPVTNRIPPLTANHDDKLGIYNDMPQIAPSRLQ